MNKTKNLNFHTLCSTSQLATKLVLYRHEAACGVRVDSTLDKKPVPTYEWVLSTKAAVPI